MRHASLMCAGPDYCGRLSADQPHTARTDDISSSVAGAKTQATERLFHAVLYMLVLPICADFVTHARQLASMWGSAKAD